jgi:hypothetical protein
MSNPLYAVAAAFALALFWGWLTKPQRIAKRAARRQLIAEAIEAQERDEEFWRVAYSAREGAGGSSPGIPDRMPERKPAPANDHTEGT